MKKLLMVGLLLGSQLIYASHEQTFLERNTPAILIGVGYCAMWGGIELVRNAVHEPSGSHEAADRYAITGIITTLCAGGCMGYGIALAQSKKLRNIVESQAVEPQPRAPRLQTSFSQEPHEYDQWDVSGDEKV